MEVVLETKTILTQRRTACFRVSLVRKIGHYCLLRTEGRNLQLWLVLLFIVRSFYQLSLI